MISQQGLDAVERKGPGRRTPLPFGIISQIILMQAWEEFFVSITVKINKGLAIAL